MVWGLDEIGKVLDWIYQGTPGWVKFLFFLSLTLVIANLLLPVMFMMTGTFCKAGLEANGNFIDFPTNIKYTWKVMQIEANVTEKGTLPVDSSCVVNVMKFDGGVVTFYKGSSSCTDCVLIDSESEYFYSANNATLRTYLSTGSYVDRLNNIGYCEGDATKKADSSLLDPAICSVQKVSGLACQPPEDYIFNWTDNQDFNEPFYSCVDSSCMNATEYDALFQQMLEDGIYPVPTVASSRESWGEVGCAANSNRPQFLVFGENIFSPVLWSVLIMLYILVMVYTYFKR